MSEKMNVHLSVYIGVHDEKVMLVKNWKLTIAF